MIDDLFDNPWHEAFSRLRDAYRSVLARAKKQADYIDMARIEMFQSKTPEDQIHAIECLEAPLSEQFGFPVTVKARVYTSAMHGQQWLCCHDEDAYHCFWMVRIQASEKDVQKFSSDALSRYPR